MREGTEGDEIYSCLCIRNHIFEGNATAGFRLATASNNLDSLLSILWREIIEHDTVAPLSKSLVKLLPVANLALNLQVLSLILAILLGTRDSVMNTTTEIYMIILKQNHIKETNTVIHSTANLNSLLLKHTHTRGCLTRIQNARLGTCINKSLLVLMRHGGDTTHSLQYVKHKALCLQKTLHLTLHAHNDIPRLDMSAILDIHLDLHCGVKSMEHLLGNLYASKNTLLFDKEFTLAHLCIRDTTKGGMVTITYILSKREVNKSVV